MILSHVVFTSWNASFLDLKAFLLGHSYSIVRMFFEAPSHTIFSLVTYKSFMRDLQAFAYFQ